MPFLKKAWASSPPGSLSWPAQAGFKPLFRDPNPLHTSLPLYSTHKYLPSLRLVLH